MLSAVNSEDGNFSSMSVINIADQLTLVDQSPLDLHGLSANAEQAAAAFIAAGTASNTVRSYRSALTYWSAWLQLRYGLPLGNGPLPATVAVQFVLDHLARPLDAPAAAGDRRDTGRRADQSQAGSVDVQYRQSPPGRAGEMASAQRVGQSDRSVGAEDPAARGT